MLRTRLLPLALALAGAAGLAATSLYHDRPHEAASRQVERIPAACIPFDEPVVRPTDRASGDQACGLPGDQDEVSSESE